ncbi:MULTISPECIES: four helix bundle protein [Chryseobacterium]|uniref:Four helix bundle protein n=1 Tax=Chryseobacterium camelliae TaxID=1265445 RepID=A0ABU0TIQ0_9FLAO|nr:MULTISPECIES: four helix bundle protein [Chryseobacterium]MDT3406075.1 four helix bundle protein [Pseudacidovorax intermedius]MDQ1096125.1 four helix bundle protein [Chryseobacterium camelliae]MDQ1100061.1 four helix bundle protein [Chryseobacterium sp. SORGH_AS_1048]MDR6087404.1 four helix bundle protein [Chryseobacterium sp. SORGH_AS_0909]MDR6131779.1 four helix bundle protein [Chryseobacterium sp. SORGH_AS_1175]
MKNFKNNLIQIKTFDFALNIIQFYIQCKSMNEFILSKQILRCGTSIGANVEEAIAAQSKKDFISKLSIANKEARETKYWLRLYESSNLIEIETDSYLQEIESIINILTKIIKTSSENL